jgi:P4 family phage/plasmid primase-like protien
MAVAVVASAVPIAPDLAGEALTYARNGFAIFPCRPRGKEPLTPHGFKDATTDGAQIRRWWTKWPDANIGLATGREHGIVVLDVDGEEAERLLAKLEDRHGKLPPTSRAKTGKGRHLYFVLPEDCGKVPSSNDGGLHIRADGGYAIAPPSVHPSGMRYEWDETSKQQFAEATQWLLHFARDRNGVLKALDGPTAGNGASRNGAAREGHPAHRHGKEKGYRAAFPDIHSTVSEPWTAAGERRLRSALAAIPGNDRDIWLKVGFALHDLTAADPRWPGREMRDEWSRTCLEKFDPAGQDKAWASFGRDYEVERVGIGTVYHLAKEYGWIDPFGPLATVHNETSLPAPKSGVDFAGYARTDAGNALAFRDLFGENLRFIEQWGCWIAWDGARWVEASDITLLPLARGATEEMIKSAAAQPAGDNRDGWIKHALATQRDARLRAMINLAKGEPLIRIEPDALDSDPWLLGCPNGTLDLRTGKLREPRREDYISKQIGASFDPEADCRQWRQFLQWVTQGDSELAAFLQAFAGYALTEEVREEKMCAFVGDGANGKSTFVMTLFDLLNNYAAKARSDLLVHAHGKEGAPSPDVAALHGKRLAIASETEDGCSLSEARIKDIVSNEVVAARRLHRDPFTFRPTHKIILATNHKPHVKGTDAGIWRRLAIVHFNATIEEERKIVDFREKVLRPELPGILNWAVDRLMRWTRDGLRIPASVCTATATYRAEMDTVGQWIEECTEADPAAIVPVNLLHNNYVNYLGPHGYPFGPRRFGEELERNGYTACKLTGGVRARRGLKLKSPGAMAHLKVVRRVRPGGSGASGATEPFWLFSPQERI